MKFEAQGLKARDYYVSLLPSAKANGKMDILLLCWKSEKPMATPAAVKNSEQRLPAAVKNDDFLRQLKMATPAAV